MATYSDGLTSEGLVDKGSALFWWRLSHRRRFWRTVWITPFYFFALTLSEPDGMHTKHLWLYKTIALAILLGTGVYEYWQWQREK
jgi:hypothetical protein